MSAFLAKMYRANADFVFTVTRDFVRACQTQILILPDDVPAHPYAVALIAAIPEADPTITRTKEHVTLRSAEVPSLLALPSGCTFHPRCPLSEAGLCDVVVPALEDLPGGRSVACHVAVRERRPAAELLGVR